MLAYKPTDREIGKYEEWALTDESVVEQKEILLKIELLLEQEELNYLLHGRATWLRQDDNNTIFFKNFASAKKKKNTIKYLIDYARMKYEDLDDE